MKTETFEEFLARGGKVTKVPAQEQVKLPESIRSTTGGGPAVLMTLDEAGLFYGEHKKRQTKKKAGPTIDLTALPPELRKKYVDDIVNEHKEETREG